MACIFGVLLFSSTAAADSTEDCPRYTAPPHQDDAQQLIMKGVACFETGDYTWALTHYQRAYELDGDPFLLGAIGRSLHELGLYDPAMAHYRRFLDREDIPSGADRIRARVEELESDLDDDAGTVSIRTAPSGVTTYVVLNNGEWHELGATPADARLREGSWEFVFVEDDHRPHRVTADVSRHEQQSLNEGLIARDSALVISSRARRRTAVWTMATSLVIGAAGGTMLVLSSQENAAAERLEEGDFDELSDFDERRRDHLDTARTTRFWGTVAAGVGATGLLAGGILFFSTPSPASVEDDEADQSAGLQLQPTVSPAQIGIRGHF